VNTFFGSLVGEKVSNMVAEMGELIFTELGRVFPNLHALANEILVNHGDSLNERKLGFDRRYELFYLLKKKINFSIRQIFKKKKNFFF